MAETIKIYIEDMRYHQRVEEEIDETVMKLPDAIYNWVVDCVSLCKERSPNGSQWRNWCTLEDTCVVDDQIWGPRDEPQ